MFAIIGGISQPVILTNTVASENINLPGIVVDRQVSVIPIVIASIQRDQSVKTKIFSFLRTILIIPEVPSGLYLAEGLVMISIFQLRLPAFAVTLQHS